MTLTFWERNFGKKTILLRPTSEGVLVPINISGQDKTFLQDIGQDGNPHAIEIIPTRIYQVRGLKGIKRLCIHDYNTTQLIDIYDNSQQKGMNERALADLLDISYQKGQKEAGASGELNNNLNKMLRIIMIIAIVSAVVSVLLYMKVK